MILMAYANKYSPNLNLLHSLNIETDFERRSLDNVTRSQRWVCGAKFLSTKE
ncbi:hypothetical protein D030_2349 [Vibrio parahaemolyticus AQ3810]|nr:hypothetical protein D030_2349 [Vibrio parahaemolyticus AQ3810]EXJ42986.1 hypothetical protein D049_2955 [Vibrio parahaemolyticus VPTS-2010]